MKIIPIKHKDFDIFVIEIPFKDIDINMCSPKFKTHVLNFKPEDPIYVKCDAEGNIDYRTKSGGVKEYRIHNISQKKLNPQEKPTPRPKIPTSRTTEATRKQPGVSRSPEKIISTVKSNKNKHWGERAVKWLAVLCAILAPVPGLILIYLNTSAIFIAGIVLLIAGYEYAKLIYKRLRAK